MNNEIEMEMQAMTEIKVLADMNYLLAFASNFCLVYLMCIAGSITREVYAYKKDSGQTFRISKILLSALLATVIMLAVIEYIDLPFPVLGMICYFFGMWGYHLINFILRAKYVAIFIKDILKELGNPILKGTANAIDEIRKEAKEDLKESEKKEQEKGIKARRARKANDGTPKIQAKTPPKELTVEDKHEIVNNVYKDFGQMDEQIIRGKIRSFNNGDRGNKAQ